MLPADTQQTTTAQAIVPFMGVSHKPSSQRPKGEVDLYLTDKELGATRSVSSCLAVI